MSGNRLDNRVKTQQNTSVEKEKQTASEETSENIKDILIRNEGLMEQLITQFKINNMILNEGYNTNFKEEDVELK